MEEEQLNRTFAALADPTRRAILAELAGGERTVNELARPYSMSLQAVSKHLKVLEQAGLITRGRDAQWRPCRIDASPIREVATWAGGYRHLWGAQFKKLDALLEELVNEENADEPAR